MPKIISRKLLSCRNSDSHIWVQFESNPKEIWNFGQKHNTWVLLEIRYCGAYCQDTFQLRSFIWNRTSAAKNFVCFFFLLKLTVIQDCVAVISILWLVLRGSIYKFYSIEFVILQLIFIQIKNEKCGFNWKKPHQKPGKNQKKELLLPFSGSLTLTEITGA